MAITAADPLPDAATVLHARRPAQGQDNRSSLRMPEFSRNLKATRFERREVIARPPLKRGTGKNRHVAPAVIVKILNTPLTRTVAIFVNRHLTVERIDRGIGEVLAALQDAPARLGLGQRQPLRTFLAEDHA